MSSRSEQLFERAKRVLPGGVSRNTILRDPCPRYVAEASGCRVKDLDGNELIDFANNMASLIHGHAHPAIVDAVSAQLRRGSAHAMGTEQEIELAEHLCARSPDFDKVRFMNSGTEAVMAGLKAARAFTDRPRIAKIEGTYHGAYDYAEVSQSPVPANWGRREHPASVPLGRGTPQGVLSDVVVLPFNDVEDALAVLDEHRGELACVLVDPIPHRVGMVPVEASYVEALYDWTRKDGALLMFDEVITFRTEVGGMQQRFDVRPDLTSMGKIIGGGFPVGCLAGRDEVMDVFVSHGAGPLLPHSGTFSANPVTMVAGLTAMRLFDQDAVERLNRLGERARANLREALALADVPGHVTGTGSLFRVHLGQEEPTDYRSSFRDGEQNKLRARFVEALYEEGILAIYTASGALSTALGEQEVDFLGQAALNALRRLRA